jgi:hypothetical protein
MTPETEITDDTVVTSIVSLARTIEASYPDLQFATLGELGGFLASMVNKPVRSVEFFGPNARLIDDDRSVANLVTGDPRGTIVLTKENGVSSALTFPTTVGEIDRILQGLGTATTREEDRFAEFEQDLLKQLDAYGHMNWSVGNEDWIACADAVVGEYQGKPYLAWHVVVDCESAGFTDTSETGVVEITPEGHPPQGILSSYLDTCYEQYATSEEEEHQIDTDACLASIQEFDEHVRSLWSTNQPPA